MKNKGNTIETGKAESFLTVELGQLPANTNLHMNSYIKQQTAQAKALSLLSNWIRRQNEIGELVTSDRQHKSVFSFYVKFETQDEAVIEWAGRMFDLVVE